MLPAGRGCTRTVEGERFESFGWAIAFTIDAGHPQYAGDLDEQAVVHRLATASGGLGSCADYLFQTHYSLRANGIRDTKLERLAGLVKAALLGLVSPVLAPCISPVSGEV